MVAEVAKIGKKGTLVIPASLRQRFSFGEGDLVIAEDHGDGILIKPAIALPLEMYSLERQAEFILSNAIDDKDYHEARKIVKKLGLDPDTITHYYPKNNKKL